MSGPRRVSAELLTELDVAELKAWQSLGRYKFVMFGYWAGIWVHLNRIGGFKRRNPWFALVQIARNEHQPGERTSAAPLFAEEA